MFAKNLSKQLCESRRRKNDTDGSSERLKASGKRAQNSILYCEDTNTDALLTMEALLAGDYDDDHDNDDNDEDDMRSSWN